MAGPCEAAVRQPVQGAWHGAGGRATTEDAAIDVLDIPENLARPVVAELASGCLRGPVLRHGPRRWAVLTAPHRRADFALPESLIHAKVRLLPDGAQLTPGPRPGPGGRTRHAWVVPPGPDQLLPPCSMVVALLERVVQARTLS
ncbi:hypothetical protein SacmaDRAFT_4187 [Saccharomonospora marina XMU15]|uniref:Uncharacterized protein n=1 Tax=Saccharomonospora marina XMU15 TaxID=882083 RepID=H5X6V1_9PSEU|nr:hypothetical protein [Saccharomonospora marina]EHR52380.1 hypothetical protein SacmaDRAFT_4187 [Saccharomonospora marina XMU15]